MSESSDQSSAYNKSNPFPAPLLKKVNLNSEGSAKETFHAEISLEGSGLSYEAGDALGVIPQNAADLVEAFLETTGLDREEVVAIDEETSLPLETILRDKVDLRIVTKVVLTKYAKAAGIDALLEKCADREWVKEYTWGRDWVDVLKDYPAGNLSAA
ncbi:MAG: sulfite reductase [NADPH] flavoprotein alpha-component, partial [Verrucomicrobiia bacterium]